MQKISCADCLSLSPAISSQFTVLFGGRGDQGRSRSSILINIKSPSPVLVMIFSKSVHICNCFHTLRAN